MSAPACSDRPSRRDDGRLGHAPAPMTGPEGKALERLFRRSCPLGQHQMADCDGILIDIAAD